jgi:ankyrin repeat protein
MPNRRGSGKAMLRKDNRMGKKLMLLTMIALVFSISFTICADEITSEEARAKLEQMEIEYTPENFIESAWTCDPIVVDLFLKAGMNVNIKDEDGLTALMMAAGSGSPETVKLLIEAGADVNAKDKDNETALLQAAFYWGAPENGIKIIKTLIDAGADVNAKNKDGETALLRAERSGNSEIVKILKKNGACEGKDIK